MEHEMKKRKRQAIETKKKIFKATMELIKEKGFDNVQIEDISKKANVSIGLFYKYFANKADVVTEAINQKADGYYLKIQEEHLAELRGEEKLLCFVEHVADYHCNVLDKNELKHNYATILMSPSRQELITKEARPIYCIIAECIEEMASDGLLDQYVQTERTSHYLVTLIRGVIFGYLLNDNYDMSTVTRHMVESYIKGLKRTNATI